MLDEIICSIGVLLFLNHKNTMMRKDGCNKYDCLKNLFLMYTLIDKSLVCCIFKPIRTKLLHVMDLFFEIYGRVTYLTILPIHIKTDPHTLEFLTHTITITMCWN